MNKILIAFLLLAALAAGAYSAGSFLVLDHPDKADAIVVLAGETDARPRRGLHLLNQHMAPHMLLDAPSDRVYDVETWQIAQDYIDRLPQREQVSVCRIRGLSTKEEAHDADRCLQSRGDVHAVLIVTSDYHTR